MSKVSIIIPSRNEPFLQRTIDDLFTNATGELEIIVILDGWWPNPPLRDNPRQIIVHRSEVRGMRDGINSAVKIASGPFLLKTDAHCSYARGFDEVLKRNIEDNWIVIPRRYNLDPLMWSVDPNEYVDSHYLSFPFHNEDKIGMHGKTWVARQRRRRKVMIDTEMMSQGSCWFMTKKHFERIDGLQEYGYGTFTQEMTELSCKTWLSGGQMMVNKNTWYAHPKQMPRGYAMSRTLLKKGAHYAADFWINNRWPKQTIRFEDFIARFNPPNWPENWQEIARHFRMGQDGLIRKEGDNLERNYRVPAEQIQAAV